MAKRKTGVTDVLKMIDEQEREAFAKFEQEQRERREKALANVLEPLRKKREELKARMAEDQAEFERIDKEIAKLTGKTVKSTGRRQRRSAEELENDAKELLKFIKAGGKDGVRGTEIAEKFGKTTFTGGPRKFLSKMGFKDAVKTEGNKTAMRYFAV